jgi:hypothetical protein
MEQCGFRPTVCRADTKQYVFLVNFRVLNQDIKVPVICKSTRIEQFEFGSAFTAPVVLIHQLFVGKLRLGIFVEIFEI